ncbi:MAG: PD-(D/E)XK nuclease family protein [Melioribacteraceae bacterium]|nr:PD-(D/E)XK nuclease family protein [Melioribacteraceae bacterium]
MKCEFLSASGGTLYEQCSYRYYNRYELSSDRGGSTPQIDSGLLTHNSLELYYKVGNKETPEECFLKASKENECANQQYFKDAKEMFFNQVSLEPRDSLDVIGTEIGFKLYLESGASARGFIDRVDFIDNHTLRIVDYKTGAFMPTSEELENSHQTKLYSAYFFTNPKYDNFDTVIFNYKYLRLNRQKNIYVYRADIPEYLEYFDHLFHSILKNNNPKPVLNSFCWNCECRSTCYEYANFITIVAMIGSAVGVINTKVKTIDEVKDLSPSEIIRIYDSMSTIATCIDKEKKNLSSWVVDLINSHSDREIKTEDGKVAKLTSRKNTRLISKNAGKELILKHNLIEEALSMIRVGDIEKIISKNKVAMKDFEEITIEEDGNPYPIIKKGK